MADLKEILWTITHTAGVLKMHAQTKRDAVERFERQYGHASKLKTITSAAERRVMKKKLQASNEPDPRAAYSHHIVATLRSTDKRETVTSPMQYGVALHWKAGYDLKRAYKYFRVVRIKA